MKEELNKVGEGAIIMVQLERAASAKVLRWEQSPCARGIVRKGAVV